MPQCTLTQNNNKKKEKRKARIISLKLVVILFSLDIGIMQKYNRTTGQSGQSVDITKCEKLMMI
jgi:hypothetical protein